jgi:hypothetical protein
MPRVHWTGWLEKHVAELAEIQAALLYRHVQGRAAARPHPSTTCCQALATPRAATCAAARGTLLRQFPMVSTSLAASSGTGQSMRQPHAPQIFRAQLRVPRPQLLAHQAVDKGVWLLSCRTCVGSCPRPADQVGGGGGALVHYRILDSLHKSSRVASICRLHRMLKRTLEQ